MCSSDLVKVAGRTWDLTMPPMAQLNDEDLAAVLTYVRREWEHPASPVDAKFVKGIRDQYATHPSWTADELKPAAPAKPSVDPETVTLSGYVIDERYGPAAVPTQDAAVVAKLDAAGAVLVAKLSLGALALNDIWFGGQTMNPWQIGRAHV